jgi:circadian clock protein KaiC
MSARVQIAKLPTGVPGLDEVLGGGLPEFSFNLIAGGPGTGKTTLAHQLVFANATRDRPALYITVVGEPPLKMLRYQQQYSFFDIHKINDSVRFLHLGDHLLESGLAGVLDAIVREVEATTPRIVVVDSFRSLVRKRAEPTDVDVENFVQRLGLHLTSWEATTFLVGEYVEQDDSNSLFSVADGILWMYQNLSRGSSVRQMQVLKVRGQAHERGLHAMAISSDGVRVFPRDPGRHKSRAPILTHGPEGALRPSAEQGRRSTGVEGLDQMLAGGLPVAFSLLVSGPAGTGKTTLANQFVLAGCARGERAVIVGFERDPLDPLNASPQGLGLETHATSGMLKVVCLGPLDLSVDQALAEIVAAVEATGATRLVLDSLSGFELALAAPYREDLRQSLYRTISALTRLGVTVMITADANSAPGTGPFGPDVSFLADGLISLRYVELGGQLRRTICVVKMRGSAHSKDICSYTIDDAGLAIGPAMTEYERITAGMPVLRKEAASRGVGGEP